MNELDELEMKKIALRQMLNATYGAIKQVKPFDEQLIKIRNEYDKIKKQLHDSRTVKK